MRVWWYWRGGDVDVDVFLNESIVIRTWFGGLVDNKKIQKRYSFIYILFIFIYRSKKINFSLFPLHPL